MPFEIPGVEFEFWCDGKSHAFGSPSFVIFGFLCDCPPLWEGPLEKCPGCDGRGYNLVDDGDGHKDEFDCGRCASRRYEAKR